MKKILIVDDILTERIHLRKILENLGHMVVEATNAKEGVDMSISQKPDLIMMDVVMPEVSGFQATRTIKKNPETNSIPIVMVTSKDRNPDKENAKENGAIGYIVKPASISSVKATIEKAFQ